MNWTVLTSLRFVAALCLATSTACRSSTESTKAAAATSGLGLVPASPLLLHPPALGFEPCRDDFSPASAFNDDAYMKLIKSPPKPTLAPLRASAHLARTPAADGGLVPSRLAIYSAGIRLADLRLGDWASRLEVSPEALARSSLPYGLDDPIDQLRRAILPHEGRVAVAGSNVRIYAIDDEPEQVARTLGVEGKRLLRIVACGRRRDDAHHRAAYRVEESKHRNGHRLRLSINSSHRPNSECSGEGGTVDLHVVPLGKADSLVIACTAEYEQASTPCDELAKAVTQPATSATGGASALR